MLGQFPIMQLWLACAVVCLDQEPSSATVWNDTFEAGLETAACSEDHHGGYIAYTT